MDMETGSRTAARSPFAMPQPGDTYQPRAVRASYRRIKDMDVLGVEHVTPNQDLEAMFQGAKLATRAAVMDREQETVRAVEIGTWIGESLVTIGQAINEAITENRCEDVEIELVAVDTFQGSPSDPTGSVCQQYGGSLCQLWHHNTCQLYRMETPLHIAVLICESVTASEVVNREELFDLINIDAEHTYEACYADIQAWWPLLRPGGYMMGHDYSKLFPGVIVAVDQSALKLTQSAPMLVQDTCVWMIQKPEEDPTDED